MPFLTVDEVGVFRRGFLTADFSLCRCDIRRVAVGGKRRRDALGCLTSLVLDGLINVALLLMHRAHRLQPFDRIAAHASVPVADSRRVRGFQAMRLKPRLSRLMGAHVWTHGHGRAIETMMLAQEAAGRRCGNGGPAADRGRARICVCDCILQDRPARQLASLLAHRLP